MYYRIQQQQLPPRRTSKERRLLQESLRQRRMMQAIASLTPRYAICFIVALFVLTPIAMTLLGGFKTSAELTSNPLALPTVWHWDNFGTVLGQGTFWQSLQNSVITMLGTVAILLIVACPAAFVFARISFRGREVIFIVFLFGLLFPAAMAILPLYIMLRDLHLLDSLWAVILPQVAYGLPTTILILRTFFQAVPHELEDATYIDGGTPVDFFWRILLPLARPSLAVIGMLTMVGSWNNFFLPLLVLNNSQLWTLPLGIMQFQGEYSTNWALVMAFISLAMIPAIIFYLFAERYIIAGLTTGAVRG